MGGCGLKIFNGESHMHIILRIQFGVTFTIWVCDKQDVKRAITLKTHTVFTM